MHRGVGGTPKSRTKVLISWWHFRKKGEGAWGTEPTAIITKPRIG